LSSKEYQNEMIRKIYDFLLQHDGEVYVWSWKLFIFVSNVFPMYFVLELFNPHLDRYYSSTRISPIFRELGYPTAIRPSTMQTIGASHTWPNLLGALTWLIEVVEVNVITQAVKKFQQRAFYFYDHFAAYHDKTVHYWEGSVTLGVKCCISHFLCCTNSLLSARQENTSVFCVSSFTLS
uniref:Kinetochore protein NDC80 n=1 Tax=Angiostrongylus cantonensis TaxID=6313 RepID=A0A0K0DGU9_ANGCA